MSACQTRRRDKRAAAYRVFDSGGLPRAIRIRRTVLESIARSMINAERSGREMAGFLAGLILDGDPRAGKDLISVEAFLPLPESFQSGPLFNYSECDRDQFIEYIRAISTGRRLVGMTRSNLRGTGRSKDDLDLMEEHFQGDGVFLLLENFGEASGTLYLSGESDFTCARPGYTFLFHPNTTAQVAAVRGEVGPPRGWPPKSDSVASRSWIKTYGFALICSVLSLLAAFAVFENRYIAREQNRSAPEAGPARELPIQLRAEQEGSGNQWRISWNRKANAVLTAEKGELTIRDGTLNKEVELTPADLRTGSVVFTPLTSDIGIQLEVLEPEPGRSLTEAIRVLGISPAETSNAGSVGAAELSDIRQLLSWQEPARKESSPRPPTYQPRMQETKAAPVDTKNLRPFRQPREGVTTVSPGMKDLPEPPKVLTLGPPPVSSIDSISRPRAPGPPNGGRDYRTSSRPAPQPNGQDTPASVGKTPALNAGAIGSLELGLREAKLLRRIEPQFPRLALKTGGPVVVRIEATIGTDGRLYGIHALSGPDTFRAAAVNAVSGWLYSPAMLHGKPIESATQIEVRFEHRP